MGNRKEEATEVKGGRPLFIAVGHTDAVGEEI